MAAGPFEQVEEVTRFYKIDFFNSNPRPKSSQMAHSACKSTYNLHAWLKPRRNVKILRCANRAPESSFEASIYVCLALLVFCASYARAADIAICFTPEYGANSELHPASG